MGNSVDLLSHFRSSGLAKFVVFSTQTVQIKQVRKVNMNSWSQSGCGSNNRYQNGNLVSANMDQDLRNPACLILSHTRIVGLEKVIRLPKGANIEPGLPSCSVPRKGNPSSVAFCSPAKSSTFNGLMENPQVGQKIKS